MKSLLVDALRQAHNSRQSQSLSDSGSFDTTNAEFENTANDPVANEEVASPEELALFETTKGAALNGDALYEESPQDAAFDEPLESVRALGSKQTIADENSVSRSGQSRSGLPALARFAPVICVTAALIAATSWALFRNSALGRDGLTMFELQSQETVDETRDNNPSTINVAAARFPFLDSAIQPENPENSE